jgi:hypothetical protein
MQFTNKIIWILSPERWGKMKVSKHHYAIELKKLGNRVYFFEPPDLTSKLTGKLSSSGEGINIINYKPLARGKRFIGSKAYSILQKIQFKQIGKKFSNTPDIVWCFDDGNFDDLQIFGAEYTIFHPVDHNLERKLPLCSATADIVLAPSTAILEYMKPAGKPGYIINHGLNEVFEQYAIAKKHAMDASPTGNSFNGKIGFLGSLFKECLNRKMILELIREYPEFNFIFFGPYNINDSNLGGSSDVQIMDFITALQKSQNVILKGPMDTRDLIEDICDIDIFINMEYQYSKRWDNSNSHKILEYLATGMSVLSTPVLMYNHTNLLFFVNDENVIESFNNLIRNWDKLNAKQEQIKRIDFALNNTYLAQILRIEKLCDDNLQTP